MMALRPKTARGVLPIKAFCIGGSGDLGTAVGAGSFISSVTLSRIRQSSAGTAANLGSRRLFLEFRFVSASP
jgi:hypothetical protein